MKTTKKTLYESPKSVALAVGLEGSLLTESTNEAFGDVTSYDLPDNWEWII